MKLKHFDQTSLIVAFSFLIGLILVAPSSLFAVDIIAGRNRIIDEVQHFDRHRSEPNEPLSCEQIRGYTDSQSLGREASFTISSQTDRYYDDGSTVGQSSRATASVGIDVNWVSSTQCRMDDVMKMPVTITADYSYNMEAVNYGCCGHANAFLDFFVDSVEHDLSFVSSIGEGENSDPGLLSFLTLTSTLENVHSLQFQLSGETCTRSMPSGHLPGPASSSAQISIQNFSFDFPQFICSTASSMLFLSFKGDGGYSSSDTGVITIVNNGSDNLELLSPPIIFSLDPGFTIIENKCASKPVLPLFDSCDVKIEFTPQDKSFSAGSLIVYSNDTIQPTLHILLHGVTVEVSEGEDDENEENSPEKEEKKYSQEELKRKRTEIQQGETVDTSVFIQKKFEGIVFNHKWAGSDIEMNLVQPDGKIIGRLTSRTDVRHSKTDISESYYIQNPMPGSWKVSLTGIDVPDEGEEDFFSAIGVLKEESSFPWPLFMPALRKQ